MKATHWTHSDDPEQWLDDPDKTPEAAAERFLIEDDDGAWDLRHELIHDGRCTITVHGYIETNATLNEEERFDGYEPGQPYFAPTGETVTVEVTRSARVLRPNAKADLPASGAQVQRLVGQLRELMAKATPGPWHYADHVGDGTTVALIGNTFIVGPPCNAVIDETPDCALIVAAVNALPALLANVEAAHAVSEEQSHMENCAAICGPPNEQWLEESRCNCLMPRLRTALSLLPNAKAQPADQETSHGK